MTTQPSCRVLQTGTRLAPQMRGVPMGTPRATSQRSTALVIRLPAHGLPHRARCPPSPQPTPVVHVPPPASTAALGFISQLVQAEQGQLKHLHLTPEHRSEPQSVQRGSRRSREAVCPSSAALKSGAASQHRGLDHAGCSVCQAMLQAQGSLRTPRHGPKLPGRLPVVDEAELLDTHASTEWMSALSGHHGEARREPVNFGEPPGSRQACKRCQHARQVLVSPPPPKHNSTEHCWQRTGQAVLPPACPQGTREASVQLRQQQTCLAREYRADIEPSTLNLDNHESTTVHFRSPRNQALLSHCSTDGSLHLCVQSAWGLRSQSSRLTPSCTH